MEEEKSTYNYVVIPGLEREEEDQFVKNCMKRCLENLKSGAYTIIRGAKNYNPAWIMYSFGNNTVVLYPRDKDWDLSTKDLIEKAIAEVELLL